MNTTEEKYHIVADSKLNGTYYVSYGAIGGGCYEFALTKYPHKFYASLQECIPMKELFERVNRKGLVYDNNNYIHIDSEILEETGGIENVKIQKSVTVSETTISYID